MKKTSLFNCTQQELYLLVPLAWEFCRKHLARFAKLKGFYTEGYVNSRLEEVKTAKAIPNYKMRKDERATNKTYLDAAVVECCNYFVLLTALIDTAFDGSMLKDKLDVAGTSYFDKSESGNEGALEDLNASALKFIVDNEVALKAKNNMANDFLDEYKAVVANYNVQRTAYKSSKSTESTVTKDNSEANNGLYLDMMKMFGDAKAIFRTEPEIRNSFTYANFVAQVVAQSVAGIRGKVTLPGGKKGIMDVIVVIEGRDKEIKTNKMGRYDVPQLATGEYNLLYTCKGYKDVLVEGFEVKTGVYNTLDVEMEPLVAVVPLAAAA